MNEFHDRVKNDQDNHQLNAGSVSRWPSHTRRVSHSYQKIAQAVTA